MKIVSEYGAVQLLQAEHVTAGEAERCEMRKVERKQSSYQQRHAHLREWYHKGIKRCIGPLLPTDSPLFLSYS